MKVLLSIKPEYVSKIFDGSKKYEYRRMIFKRSGIETAVVYASDPIKRIIGEFDIGEILYETPEQLWERTNSYAGISKTRFMTYFKNQDKGYAISIKKLRKYRDTLTLDDLMVALAPQSFMYLEDAPLQNISKSGEASSNL
jgi:predicted transcriptional regulator